MAGLNRVVLIGNLGRAPELRYTQGGKAVMTMRLATTETFMGRDKEPQQRTEWHTVVLWGKRAEGLSKHLHKGSQLAVEGRSQTRSWENKNGDTRYATEVIAKNVVLLGGKRATQEGGEKEEEKEQRPSEPPHGDDDFGDDDIPF